MKRYGMCGAFASLAIVAVGCHDGKEPATGVSRLAAAVVVGDSKTCPPEFTVDDVEDNNNQIVSQKGRGGYWYTYADKVGTSITPAAGAKFLMAPGGAQGSGHAARMSGEVAGGEIVFAGMGFGFTDPKKAYDASAFTGVSFWAKVDGASTAQVRLKVPDVNTDPAGGVCGACFNDFGVDLTLTNTWTKYTVPFAAMAQQEGWGDPHPAAIDPSKLYGLQWQVNTPGSKFDVWIDDVQFTGCP